MEYQIEGRNAVAEAIKSGRDIDKIFALDGGDGRLNYIIRNAEKNKIVVVKTDRKKLDAMSKTGAHQGIIAQCAMVEYAQISDILKLAEEKGEQPFVIIADSITDPHNLGAIIRTACAAGAHGIIIPKRRSVGINETVAKVSVGAVEHIKIVKAVNLRAAIDELKEKGLWIVGTDVSGEKTIYNQDLKGPIGVVIGSEGEGMSRIVKEACDFLVRIPMIGEVQSLNASVAAGVIMYEIVRQRNTEE